MLRFLSPYLANNWTLLGYVETSYVGVIGVTDEQVAGTDTGRKSPLYLPMIGKKDDILIESMPTNAFLVSFFLLW